MDLESHSCKAWDSGLSYSAFRPCFLTHLPQNMVRPISGVKTELQVPALLDCGEVAVREERLGSDRGKLGDCGS